MNYIKLIVDLRTAISEQPNEPNVELLKSAADCIEGFLFDICEPAAFMIKTENAHECFKTYTEAKQFVDDMRIKDGHPTSITSLYLLKNLHISSTSL